MFEDHTDSLKYNMGQEGAKKSHFSGSWLLCRCWSDERNECFCSGENRREEIGKKTGKILKIVQALYKKIKQVMIVL